MYLHWKALVDVLQSGVMWVGELAQTQMAIVPTILVEGLRNTAKKDP